MTSVLGKSTMVKTLERDTTLAMQAFFSRAMVEDMKKRYGFEIPYRPTFMHYVTDANIQIWENEEGESWFVARLLEEKSFPRQLAARNARSKKTC